MQHSQLIAHHKACTKILGSIAIFTLGLIVGAMFALAI